MESFSYKSIPVTIRRAIEITGLVALGFAVVAGRDVLMPLLMAFFLSLMILPVVRWLRRHKVPEGLSIFIGILLLAVVVGGVLVIFSFQIGMLLQDIPSIRKNLTLHWATLSGWLNHKLHFSAAEQISILQKQAEGLGNSTLGYMRGAAVSLTGILIFVGLLPIYIFLILYYKNTLLKFVFMWVHGDESKEKMRVAMHETETMVKSYLVGLLIQVSYLTVLVGGALALLGIPHAWLIGILFAVLNLIPYVGAIISNLISVLLTISSSQDLTQVWIVLGTIAAVQFIDNNILMPRIVGGKVKVNALASIVGIIVGGSLAGVSGMFLSIPIMAILKIMFDKTETMRQWGILIGDDRPKVSPTARIFRRRKRPVPQAEPPESKI